MEVMELLADMGGLMTEPEDEPCPRSAVWDAGWPQTIEEFERLVEAFQDRLVRYAYRRLGNLSDAEEIAQEVFLRAYADKDQRKTVANVSAYLYRMTGNLAMDLVRRRKGQTVSVEEVSRFFEIPSKHPDPFKVAAAAEEIQSVEQLLSHVRPEQAEAIRLRVFDELPPRVIAEVLGCRLATVKSRLRYGIDKLREIAARDWGKDQ
jgi:RNA polymerase sigma-70 factor (ECF subfamily)